jgi:hypothetical protein
LLPILTAVIEEQGCGDLLKVNWGKRDCQQPARMGKYAWDAGNQQGVVGLV